MRKNVSIVLIILGFIFSFIGGTLSYSKWRTSEAQKTEVTFTLEEDFSCAADGGGDITSADVMLAPATCTNEKHAIKREITAKPTLFGTMNVYMDLWLEIDSLDSELAASSNFKYALSTNANSCENGVITSGTFSELTAGDTVPLLTQKEYMETLEDTYYLYVWLDKEETSTTTMNKKFSLSLNGNCENSDKASYVVYSATDNSLRFYKNNNTSSETEDDSGASQISNMLIEDETTTENTETYADIENITYSSLEAVPWHAYRDSITTVIVEEPMSPKSIQYWFRDMKNVTYMDLSKLNTSRVTNLGGVFYQTGYNSSSFEIIGLENWDTSHVTSIGGIFQKAGYSATTFDIGDLSNWNVSNVTGVTAAFHSAAYNAINLSINLSNWNLSKVNSFYEFFAYTNVNGKNFSLNLTNWDVSNVTNMYRMFINTGCGADASLYEIIGLDNWNVSSVTNMAGIFQHAGVGATTFDIGDLSNWDVSSVTNMGGMFGTVGMNATTFDIGDLSDWDVSSVTNMSNMFQDAGSGATTWNIGDISNWDVSNVTNMFRLFYNAGYNSSKFDIGDLSNWDVSNVTNMSSIFGFAGLKATTFNIGDISKWNTTNVTDMSNMFYKAGLNATYSLNLSGWNVNNVTTYSGFNTGVESKITPPTWVN